MGRMTKALLAVSSLAEAATGLALLVYPRIVIHLLFGADIADAGLVMSRIAGIALIALGVACFPGAASRAHCAMLTYSALATIYLLCLGLTGRWTGKFLWPAVALHAILTLLLAWGWSRARAASAKTEGDKNPQQSTGTRTSN